MSTDLLFYLLNKYDLMRFANQLKQKQKRRFKIILWLCSHQLEDILNNRNHFQNMWSSVGQITINNILSELQYPHFNIDFF